MKRIVALQKRNGEETSKVFRERQKNGGEHLEFDAGFETISF